MSHLCFLQQRRAKSLIIKDISKIRKVGTANAYKISIINLEEGYEAIAQEKQNLSLSYNHTQLNKRNCYETDT